MSRPQGARRPDGSGAGARVALTALLSLAAACGDAARPVPSAPAAPSTPFEPVPPEAPNGLLSIYLAAADGTQAVRLTRGYAPAWSPDGRRIAFYRADGMVYVIGADGSGERRLAGGDSPSWSPDGRRIVFTTIAGISVMNADGSGLETIVRRDFTSRPGIVDLGLGAPAWSPDGQWIAFTLYDVDHGSPLAVFLATPAGSDVHRVTAEGSTYGADSPSWAPDGSRLAFVDWGGDDGGAIAITVHDLLGRAPDVRYRDPADGALFGRPAWSPDGRRLAFAVPVLSLGAPWQHFDIWTMPLTGGGARVLIRDGTSPSWSPDGTRIAYVSTAGP